MSCFVVLLGLVVKLWGGTFSKYSDFTSKRCGIAHGDAGGSTDARRRRES